MRPRTAALLLLAVSGLLLVGAGLCWQLLRSLSRAAQIATADRLLGIGGTAARALALGADPRLLDEVRRDSELEDAYLLDRDLRPLGRPGRPVNLLRIDPDRVLQALGGTPWVGPAYRIESLNEGTGPEEAAPLPDGEPAAKTPPRGAVSPAAGDVLAGYFPVKDAHVGTRVLVLEAGAAFAAVPRRLRAVAWAATAGAGVLALLFVVAVGAALQAAARERRLYGQAQRGQAVAQMAAMVAHEIRNPLSTIRAGAELLREQGQGGELVGDILDEVARLSALTGEFLTLARDPPLSLGEVDVAALCDDVCEQLRRRAAGLTVVRSGPAAGTTVHADEGKVRQVLLNLLGNAEQAMDGKGRLEVAVRGTGGGVEVLVKDDGPGIGQPLSRRLFEPFATTKAGGTGLGLVISRRIAEKHGGSLELVGTAAGAGACFALRLPRRPPETAASMTDSR